MADELKLLPSKRITCSGRKSDGSACRANIEGPHEHDAGYAELMGIVPAEKMTRNLLDNEDGRRL